HRDVLPGGPGSADRRPRRRGPEGGRWRAQPADRGADEVQAVQGHRDGAAGGRAIRFQDGGHQRGRLPRVAPAVRRLDAGARAVQEGQPLHGRHLRLPHVRARQRRQGADRGHRRLFWRPAGEHEDQGRRQAEPAAGGGRAAARLRGDPGREHLRGQPDERGRAEHQGGPAPRRGGHQPPRAARRVRGVLPGAPRQASGLGRLRRHEDGGRRAAAGERRAPVGHRPGRGAGGGSPLLSVSCAPPRARWQTRGAVVSPFMVRLQLRLLRPARPPSSSPSLPLLSSS
ncbi:unnamed protein product, partial [Prorocentrum cordatum]